MKFMTRLILSAIILSLCFGQSHATDKKSKNIIKKIQKRYKALETLQADFEREVVWELADETHLIKGSLYVKADSKYRIETDDETVVTDGKTVWTYSASQNYVMIDLISKAAESQLPGDIVLKYAQNYEAEYLGEEEIDGNKVHLLKLTPKSEDDFIMSMKIWVDDKKSYMRKIEQIDLNENIDRYTVRNIRENQPIEEKLFTFAIPEGAEIVDLTEE